MNGIFVLLLLIFASALPVIVVFFIFRARKSAVTLPWFLASLATGIISLFIVALIQRLFSSSGGVVTGSLGSIFFDIFIRIALVEELSRLITVFPLVIAGRRRLNMDRAYGAALGLTAGLGFAMIENASYGITDINIALLRAVTAAPLHGACGIRAGMAAFIFRQHPGKALFLFITATLIHGAYNLMIVSPALPSILAVPIAFAALFASLVYFGHSESDDENSIFPE